MRTNPSVIRLVVRAGEACFEAVRVDAPEVEGGAVDEEDRNLLPVLLGEGGVVEDRALLEGDAVAGAGRFDDGPGVIAQMAVGLADERHDHGVNLRRRARSASLDRMVGTGPATATDVLSSYRRAGQASAAAAGGPGPSPDGVAAFFDVDNTIMRGASMFHLAVGLARRNYFSFPQIAEFAVKQMKFIASGSEDMEDMASATEAALSFVAGRNVEEITGLGEAIFDEIMIDKLIPGSLALAQGHLDAGQQVWLVTATPIELASTIAKRLGLTGALGTVSKVEDGVYTGHLDGPPLHGLAKAEAVRALAAQEDLDLARCWAYSDSANDIPMLSAVGNPVAVNPEPTLRAHARDNDWRIRDFRKRVVIKRAATPALMGAAGLGVGMALGYAMGMSRRLPRA